MCQLRGRCWSVQLPNDVAAPFTPLEDESQPHGAHLVTDTYLENVLEKTYDDRRESSKKNASCQAPKVAAPRDDREPVSMSDGSAFRNAFSSIIIFGNPRCLAPRG